MRYFIGWGSSLMNACIAVVPLGLLMASLCNPPKSTINPFHPYWHLLNDPEDHLDQSKAIFTKFGSKGLRFHVTDRQQPLHAHECCAINDKNIVDTDPAVHTWVLTPNFYGSVTAEKFPKTMQAGMKYRSYDDQQGGIPGSFFEELSAIDDIKGAILIIATGIEGKLGVSESLRKAISEAKAQSIIKDYIILKSGEAVKVHNRCVQEGEKVFTFVHTVG